MARAGLFRLLAIVSAASLSTCALGAVAQQASLFVRYNLGEIASIAIPSDATLLKPESTAVDFYVYTVVFREQKTLGMYFGNAPNFPFDGSKQLRIGKCLVLSTTTSSQGEESRGVLMGIENAQNFPTRLHMFYRNLNTETARQADEVIASMRFLIGQDCMVDDSRK